MIKKIINAIKEGTFFDRAKHVLRVNFLSFYRKLIRKSIKIDNKQILFITFQGKYTCNPKAIAEELINEKSDYKLVWVIKKEELKNRGKYPKELKLVVKESLSFYKEIEKSKFIIQNANDTVYMKYKKRPGQVYLQCWHGSLGFKKIDKDSVKNLNWVKMTQELAAETDYIISNSKFENEVFRTSYWPNTKILEYGHPRNDILLNPSEYEKIKNKVKKLYNIDKKTKVVLFAPTFRDNFDPDTYDFNYEQILSALSKKFGGKWVLLLRYHYKFRNINFSSDLSDKVINVTNYYDMQDLLCVADIGITDYSSWMCDFVLTGKPGFLYTLDIEKYIDERGFYYPLESSPFLLAKSNDELCDKILNFDENKYKKNVNKFLKDRGCFEKGNASKSVVEFIKKL